MHAVIMAGGSGTRFWPVSRKARPKQFLSITGTSSMLSETCDRISAIIEPAKTVVVLGEEHLVEAARILSGRPVHLIAEPVGRNTAACIGLGALYMEHLGHKGPTAFLPADHYIGDSEAFLESLKAGFELAQEDCIVTLGIVPTRPDTGYGYIRRGDAPFKVSGQTCYRARQFVEKPDQATAQRYLREGVYYWNAGIFVARQDIIAQEIEEHMPALAQGLKKIKAAIETDGFEQVISEVYAGLPSISFDYGIMEKTRREINIVECDCGWSDVGSWQSLHELRRPHHDREGNLLEGDPIAIECKNSFISARGRRKTACLGLRDCLVVDTPDALLVADLGRSQDIKLIVERLKELGEVSVL
jgi:mannose-1-phosphate guanylyltransferase